MEKNIISSVKRQSSYYMDVAKKRSKPIFCAAACLALKKMSPDVDVELLKDFLIEIQTQLDEHPADIFKACRDETGICISIENGGDK